MKIRIFIAHAGVLGGLQVLSLRLAQLLKKQGHDVRIIGRFTIPDSTENYVRMETPRVFTLEGVEIEIISIRGWRRWLLWPVPLLRHRPKTFPIARMLYEAAFRSVMSRILKGTDLAHFLGHGVEMLGYSVEAGARRKEIPFVVQPAIHVGQAGHGHADWPLYKKADMVVAHTQFEADTLRQGGIEDSHVHLMRLGFDDPGPGDGARFRQAHGIEGPIILFVGRRCADKGYFLLLEAFASLRKQMPNVILVIAGPGEIARSTAEGVLELGRVPDEVKRDALAACTVFCMPSKGESFGIVYFEAWNFGKPVIGLDLPILRETIGSSGGGLLAVPDRPDDLVEKLKHLLEQPQLALEMGTRGREYSRSFSWDNALKACIEAYSQAQQNQRQ